MALIIIVIQCASEYIWAATLCFLADVIYTQKWLVIQSADKLKPNYSNTDIDLGRPSWLHVSPQVPSVKKGSSEQSDVLTPI